MKNIKIKTGSILIAFNVIFPVQFSEFIKSVSFGRNFKKIAWKKNIYINFHIKFDFYRWKIFSLIYNEVYSDRSKLNLSDGTIRI